MLPNLLKLATNNRDLTPQIAVYYVTMQCNLNCAYCEDFGSRRNHQVTQNPSLDDAKKILRVIRSGVSRLWLTGGEPLMHPQILELLDYVRNELKFSEISLITNGTLLSRRFNESTSQRSESANQRVCDSASQLPITNYQLPNYPITNYLSRLIISLDSVDVDALNLISLPNAQAENVIANVREVAKLQKERGFKLILNAVITPETLAGMDKLIFFCLENNVWLSFSPQSVNNLPRYDLATSPEYRAFIKKLIEVKKHGGFIMGSEAYLNMLVNQTPYECYPTLAPRVTPDGWLAYPCRPMEKAGGEQGGLAVNLLDVNSWDEAWKIAQEKYGEAPTSCVSCFQQCYAEPSLMQARPLEYLRERLRGVDLSAYVAG